MSVATETGWREEFGVGDAGPRSFFASKAELNAPGVDASQGHVVRRAFDLLKLDGVLCTENTPLVYFKQVKRIETAEVARLHRKFWNHGGAPILVLVAPDRGSCLFGSHQADSHKPTPAALFLALWKLWIEPPTAIGEFLPAVESGEFFRKHEKSFNPAHRVDRELLDNLQATREKLVATSAE